MTDDTLNPEAIRADMKAGTPGTWREWRDASIGGYEVYKIGSEKNWMRGATLLLRVMRTKEWNRDKHDARRIARLPDLEQGYLDAIAERDRLREALENLLIAIGMGWDLGGVTEAARAAFTDAQEGRDDG